MNMKPKAASNHIQGQNPFKHVHVNTQEMSSFRSLVCVSSPPPSDDEGWWAQSELPHCETSAGRGPYGNHDNTESAVSAPPSEHKRKLLSIMNDELRGFPHTQKGFTWMMLVPFLKLVKERMTSWLITSTDCFHVFENPRTSWVIRADGQETLKTSAETNSIYVP